MKLVILNEDQMNALRDVLQDDVVVVMTEEMFNILCQETGHPPDSAEEVIGDVLYDYACVGSPDYMLDVVSEEYHAFFQEAKEALLETHPTTEEYPKFH